MFVCHEPSDPIVGAAMATSRLEPPEGWLAEERPDWRR